MDGLRVVAVAAFAVFVFVACGGDTADTSSDDAASASASEPGTTTAPESGTTTVPEPDAAVEQPDNGGDTADTSSDDGASEPATVVSTTTAPESLSDSPQPETVRVTPATTELTALDSTAQFSAEVLDQNGQTMVGAETVWSSGATSVATVDGSGLVTAVGNGATTITATAGTISQSATVSVAQTVNSITVLPAAVELSGLGATAQLTAEAFDANGNPAAGAELLWRSSDVAVLTVNTGGLVTTAGAGTATITATAGAASSAATVTVTGFTLSGTVTDSRIEGLAVPGVVLRLSNGTREFTTTDDEGQYRFSNVLGQVDVAVTSATQWVRSKVQVTVDSEDRTLDFVLEHTGLPPYAGTVWVTPDILGPSDPTSLESVTYVGRGLRDVFDRRVDAWATVDAYLFDVQFGEQTVEFQVNPEFGSEEAAREQVDRFAPPIGRLPPVLMSGIRQADVNAGNELFGGNAGDGSLLIHTDIPRWHEEYLEEVFLHEGAHISLDPSTWDAPGWRSAQEADGVFISVYARDYPDREDVAESFLVYFALRQRPDRLTTQQRWSMVRTIPNRIAYFDEQQFDMSTGPPSDMSTGPPDDTRSEIRGTLVGPDGQPLGDILIWAWSGNVDSSGHVYTRHDGTFAISVPNGRFTLDIYAAADGSCAGWYDGASVTNDHTKAVRIGVAGQDIDGITIRLPALREQIPSGSC